MQSVVIDGAQSMESCSQIESIDSYLELLITTCPGEHKFDKNFGCRIWDMDFENVVSRKEWVDQFKAHVQDSVERYEKRLANITVYVDVMEVTQEDRLAKTTSIKKKVAVKITGTEVTTNMSCAFKYALYLGPLSVE